MQAVEGSLDAGRLAFLQRMLGDGDAPGDDASEKPNQRITVKYADHGLLIGARTNAKKDSYAWEITQWLFPFYTTAPPQPRGLLGSLAWVPVDDESTMAFAVTYHPTRPLSRRELQRCRNGEGLHPKLAPGTYRRQRNRTASYLLEGEAANTRPLASIAAILEKALLMQESMGPIVDRTQENLGPNDVAVFAARDRLLKAAIDLREGMEPAPARRGDLYRVRSGSAVLKRGVEFDEDESVKSMLFPQAKESD
jgi:hypothetical protein